MKIVDLDNAIAHYNHANKIKHNVHDNKYLFLEVGNEIYSLMIKEVNKEAIHLGVMQND